MQIIIVVIIIVITAVHWWLRSAYNGLNRNFPNNEWGNYMSRMHPYYNNICFIYIDPKFNPIIRLIDANLYVGGNLAVEFCEKLTKC